MPLVASTLHFFSNFLFSVSSELKTAPTLKAERSTVSVIYLHTRVDVSISKLQSCDQTVEDGERLGNIPDSSE